MSPGDECACACLRVVVLFVVTLSFQPFVDAALHQLAYGLRREYQSFAKTRILHYKEVMALDCNSGNRSVTWYRRALKAHTAKLGGEEIVYETLLMDHDMVGNKLKKQMINQHPQQYKFQMKKTDKGLRLLIHDAEWHDLGQYYCADDDDAEVIDIILVYYRPVVLYFENEERIEKNKLLGHQVDGIDGMTFLSRLEDNDEDELEYPIHVGKKGTLTALWRAYPFIDNTSAAFKGLEHSGIQWDKPTPQFPRMSRIR